PQVWASPALTATKLPTGWGGACPWLLSPQQAILLSVRMAQACCRPTLSATNVPPGGVFWAVPPPQQARAPSLRIAPAFPPALTDPATDPGAAPVVTAPTGTGTPAAAVGSAPSPSQANTNNIPTNVARDAAVRQARSRWPRASHWPASSAMYILTIP